MPHCRAVLSPDIEADARRALAHYRGLGDPQALALSPLGGGLINLSLLVDGPEGRFVLQRLNPIFDPAIHHDIETFTRRLDERGLVTPRLRPTASGALWVDLGDGGVWRMWRYLDGDVFDQLISHAQAQAAGELVGRVHAALDGLDHRFTGRRLGVHDTDAHLDALRRAVREHPQHPLAGAVVPLAAELEQAAAAMPPLVPGEERICHGDLKLSNVLFAGPQRPDSERAVCLIDLDTVGPMPLAHELGDAWRSWCNPAAEDAASPSFDLGAFTAAWDGYRRAYGKPIAAPVRRALLGAPGWIALELSARFAADTLCERYFGWDSSRYRSRGEHNLARARSQLALHRAAQATAGERARLLDVR